MIAWNGGCCFDCWLALLTPMQKKVFLFLFFSFAFVFSSFSLLVILFRIFSSSRKVGNISGAIPAILSAAACLG